MKHTQCAVKLPDLLNQVFTSICTSIYLINGKLPMVGFTIKMSKQTNEKKIFKGKEQKTTKKSNIVIQKPKKQCVHIRSISIVTTMCKLNTWLNCIVNTCNCCNLIKPCWSLECILMTKP